MKSYCVYHHILDGRIIYIGQGNANRPFQLADSARNPQWNKIVCDNKDKIVVTIVAEYDNIQDARDEEKRQIKSIRPIANVRYACDVSNNTTFTFRIDPKTKRWFESRAAHCNTTVSRMASAILEEYRRKMKGKVCKSK